MGDKIKIEVEVFSDVICPWCYIGQKKIMAAAEMHGNAEITLRWRAFLLNPKMPRGGMARSDYLTAKFGATATALLERIAIAGSEAGINFNFDAISRTPDSRPAHGLVLSAGDNAGVVAADLFDAYFVRGLDIGDDEVLGGIAAAHGLAYPAPPHITARIEQDVHDAARLGLGSVPTYIFGGEMMLSGAHAPKTFLPMIDAAVTMRQIS